MATTYYQTDLTKEQIEQALHAVNGVASSTNNGKVLFIDENGEIKAKSAAEWQMHLIPKTITQNGSYDPASDNADGYNGVSVNVPNSYAAADEGKVVSGGALVAQTARTPAITENGTYDTTGNNSVTVNVPSQAAPVLQPKTVTENGDYYPPAGVDGFSEFHVNVSGGGGSTPVIQPLNVSQNGTYPVPAGVDGFGPVVVNVSGGGGSTLIGPDPPTANIGNVGDYYIQESSVILVKFGITISEAGRDNSYNFTYWGARDIQIVFDDGAGNEILLKDLEVKSCKWANGNSTFSSQNDVINGNTGSYYEHSGLPGYWYIECEIPSTYLLKSLKIWPRSDNAWRDFWRSFTFAQWSEERVQIGTTLLSESGLVYDDWPSSQYKVFNLGNAPIETEGSGNLTRFLYYKTSEGWILLK